MPTGGAGGEQGCREQGHLPATCHLPPSPFPAVMKKQQQHAVSLPYGCTGLDHSPSTGSPGRNEKKREHEQHPVGSLPVDALVEILSRVPYKSLYCFKCVSEPWLSLCSDPDIRKRCPQTLSGFFYSYRERVKFHNLSGRGPPLVDPSLPFLRGRYHRFMVEQCCGGLLLCKCWEEGEYDCDYVVCNPMTGQFAVLPPIVLEDKRDYPVCFEPVEIFLGFDVAVPCCFVVFVPMTDILYGFTELSVYSSETGRWTRVQTEWGYKTIPQAGNSGCVFLNGTMHLAIHYGYKTEWGYKTILTVDTEGKAWGEIKLPDHTPGSNDKVFIGQSQGRLHAWQIGNDHDGKLYVWVLEDYVTAEWTLTHTATVSELFGRQNTHDDMSYYVFAMHPDCNTIFITDEEEMAVSYDMDNLKVNVSCTFEEFQDVLPYVPCFAEWSSDGH